MRFILFSIVISFCTSAFAQKETLSLEDAIMGRWSKFAPERINGLKWVKNSNEFSYLEKDKLILENLDGATREILLSDLNTHFSEDSLSRFPDIVWMDQERFRFQKNSIIYVYNISDGQIEELINYNEDAQNMEFSEQALAMAYTIDNNLFIQDSKGTTHQITSDDEADIVNGQAVHRYEFGVSKGTFWSNNGENLAFYRKDESMVTDYPLVNTDARIAEANNIKYPMAGMKSHHVTLGIYNLESQKTIFVKTGEPKEQYLTNIAWGPEDKFIYIAILNRDQNHMKLNKYDVKTGDFVKTLFEE